jgi:hypothetical protein
LLRWFRRLRIRWEIRDDIHLAFVTLGCAIICWRRLRGPRSQGHPLLTLQCFTFGRNPITAVRSAHLHTVRLRDDAGAEA